MPIEKILHPDERFLVSDVRNVAATEFVRDGKIKQMVTAMILDAKWRLRLKIVKSPIN